MDRDEIIRALAEHRVELARLGVKSLALFGSTARDETGEQSDLDFLVEFTGPGTFTGYMDLKFFLEDLLGRRVDLVTQKALKASLRDPVEREAIHVPGF